MLPLEAVLRRDRLFVAAGLAGVVALAWAYTAYWSWSMGSAGPEMGIEMAMPSLRGWSAADFLLTFVMWAVMMAAMMVRSATPMVLTFATINRKRREQARPFVPASVFLLGYLLVWGGFAAAATIAQWGLHQAAMLSITSSLLGGALLLAAGIYQWSPLKRICLTQCRSPLGFLMSDWREGTRGVLVMGLRHGSYCVGCCWVLMGLLFVAGVVNLLWVVVIAAFILLEKVAPLGPAVNPWVSRASGLALTGWGLVVIVVALAW